MANTLPPTSRKRPANEPYYCPTPAQIRACCVKIQREWSPEERAKRRLSHGGFDLLRLEFLPESEHPHRTTTPEPRFNRSRRIRRAVAG